MKEIKKANVSTYEPYYLSLVLDLNKNVTINALLYTENVVVKICNPIEDMTYRLCLDKDFESVIRYHDEDVDIGGEWLKAICGTDLENIGSQKSIENNGFYPYHRILNIEF